MNPGYAQVGAAFPVRLPTNWRCLKAIMHEPLEVLGGPLDGLFLPASASGYIVQTYPDRQVTGAGYVQVQCRHQPPPDSDVPLRWWVRWEWEPDLLDEWAAVDLAELLGYHGA